MSCDIDAHVTSKYDIKKRIGKGVGSTSLFVGGLVVDRDKRMLRQANVNMTVI